MNKKLNIESESKKPPFTGENEIKIKTERILLLEVKNCRIGQILQYVSLCHFILFY